MNAKAIARVRGAVTERGPLAVDMHVGARIRMRRRFLGISQQSLAAQLGITFQQVQKYERGANRVSASKLYEIACALNTPVIYFFEGLADPLAGSGEPKQVQAMEQSIGSFLQSSEGVELATMFARVDRPRTRRMILDLVRTLAEEDSSEG
jgi:transcriptional regulator with XRE-family HTH domain